MSKKDGRGKHPNSRANLKMWDEGESGNPNGRPKGKSFATVFNQLLDAKPLKKETKDFPEEWLIELRDQLGRDLTRRDLMSMRMLIKATIQGDVSAFNAVADRIDGKPVSDKAEGPVNETYVDFLKGKLATLGEGNDG